jgi:hypothetical protein
MCAGWRSNKSVSVNIVKTLAVCFRQRYIFSDLRWSAADAVDSLAIYSCQIQQMLDILKYVATNSPFCVSVTVMIS